MRGRSRVLVTAAVACVVVAVVLLDWDVSVPGGREGEDSWACGPAFKAVHGDTFSGGEMPANMAPLDAACADRAARFVWTAGVAAVVLMGVALPGLAARRRAVRSHGEGPPNVPLR